MPNINFVAEYSGYAILNNDADLKPVVFDGKKIEAGKPIVQFSPFNVLDPIKGQYVTKGYVILDNEKDKERIAFVKSYGDNKKAYKEVKSLPRETYQSGGVVTGVSGAPNSPVPDVKAITKSIVEKTRAWMALQQKLFNKNGEQKKDVEEAELNEFNELSKELNLK